MTQCGRYMRPFSVCLFTLQLFIVILTNYPASYVSDGFAPIIESECHAGPLRCKQTCPDCSAL